MHSIISYSLPPHEEMAQRHFHNVVEEMRDGKSNVLGRESVILKPTCALESPVGPFKKCQCGE